MKVFIGPYTDDGNEQEISIQIDPYDTWSMDYTLSRIIVPMLEQLKATKHGAPPTDDEDVPEELRNNGEVTEDGVDENWFKRWDYILDEMIWAFKLIRDDSITSILDEAINNRISNGTRLFGKYYRNLWD